MPSAIATLARKDLRLLFRDPRAVLILLAMPLVFILVLGVNTLGDGFGPRSRRNGSASPSVSSIRGRRASSIMAR